MIRAEGGVRVSARLQRSVAVIAALALLATACTPAATVGPTGSPGGSPGPTGTQAAGPIELTHWYYDFPPFANYQKQRATEFETANPGVTIKYDSSIPPVGEGGFEDKITSALATGTAPDVFSVFSPQAPRIIDKGQLAPIDEAAVKALGYESIEAMKAERVDGAFDAWTDANGTIYGIPDAISFLTLYCNNDQLMAGGVDPSTLEMKTWDDFIAMGKKVIAGNKSFYQDASGAWTHNFIKLPMYQDDGWSMQVLQTFLSQSGGSVLSADGSSYALNSSEGVAAVSTIMKISRELGDPNIGPVVPGEIHSAVASGDQTCGLAGEWFYGAFLKPSESPLLGHYTAFLLPRIDPGKAGNVFWGWSFVVNATSKNKDTAWKYIGYLTADPNGIIADVGIWPPVKDVTALQAVKDTPFGDVIAANREGAQHLPKSLKYSDIARLLRGKIESMAFEGTDVKSTLDAAAEEVNQILAQ
jgi:ABC-type glycerol-3-phosphate transport system substrate-binding protein